MESVVVSPGIEELQAQITELLAQVQRLQSENHQLNCAEDEKRIALDVVQQQQQQISTLEAQVEYSKLELNRTKADLQESRREYNKAQKKLNNILTICAIPRSQMLPNTKLAWITSTEQAPYSDVLHGGQGEHMLTSMKQWNIAIGGNEENTNCLNDALKPLEEVGAITRTRIDLNDGRKHYEVRVDENMLSQAKKFQKMGEPNKHNGGDKRCPNCKVTPLKKSLQVTYECPGCGVDFDKDMNPINHRLPAPLPAVEEPAPEPTNVLKLVPRELPMQDDTPLPDAPPDEFETMKAAFDDRPKRKRG